MFTHITVLRTTQDSVMNKLSVYPGFEQKGGPKSKRGASERAARQTKRRHIRAPSPQQRPRLCSILHCRKPHWGAEVPGAAREAGSQGTGCKRAGLWALLSDLLSLFHGQAGFSTCLARLFFWQVWVQVSWESLQAEPCFSMWVHHSGLISGQVPRFKKFLCLL